MKRLTVGFSKPKSFWKPFAWAIRLYDGTTFSHVYMKHLSEKYGSALIYQASGAQVNFMSQKHFDHIALALHEYHFDVTDEEFDQYMKWAIENAGAPYSLGKIFEILFHKDIWKTEEPEWVCSVLAGFALKSKADPGFNWSLATPKDIENLCIKHGKKVF